MTKKRKNTYNVTIPTTGVLSIEIAADTKEDAVDLAWEKFHETGVEGFEHGWEAHDNITTGNMFCGRQNSVEVVLTDGGEDDDETL
jgi:hypothetical protein